MNLTIMTRDKYKKYLKKIKSIKKDEIEGIIERAFKKRK